MELDKIKTYFPVDYRGRGKNGALFYIFPEIVFDNKQFEEVRTALQEVKKRFEGLYTNTTQSVIWITIGVDLSDFPNKSHDEIIESLITALNNVTEIQKVVINDGRPVNDDTKSEIEECDTIEENYWDDALGLTNLDLSYTAHVDGFDGECFDYSVYFTDDTADEEKADAVRNAIQSFDFNVTGDDYIGYISVSSDNNKVSIYLDLGNVQPQNENKIIQGILLALNSVQGIKKVIINEGCI